MFENSCLDFYYFNSDVATLIGARLGLLGLNRMNLRIIADHGNPDEQKLAKNIMKVRRKCF